VVTGDSCRVRLTSHSPASCTPTRSTRLGTRLPVTACAPPPASRAAAPPGRREASCIQGRSGWGHPGRQSPLRSCRDTPAAACGTILPRRRQGSWSGRPGARSAAGA